MSGILKSKKQIIIVATILTLFFALIFAVGHQIDLSNLSARDSSNQNERILEKLESLDKLDEILRELEELKTLNKEAIKQLGLILTFVENQEAFNIQLMEAINGINLTETNTVVYEIHNETLVQVENTYIENATFVYNIEEVNIEEFTLDIDLYAGHHNHFFIKVNKGKGN